MAKSPSIAEEGPSFLTSSVFISAKASNLPSGDWIVVGSAS
jgi:hypothetical protein